jgi:hypothetical protein
LLGIAMKAVSPHKSHRSAAVHAAGRDRNVGTLTIGRGRAVVQGAVVFAALLMIVGGAILLWGGRSNPEVAARPGSSELNSVGLIKLAPDGGLCREVVIDNKAGPLHDTGRVPCDSDKLSDIQEAIRQRAGGGRLDRIRDSFNGR